MSPNPHPSTTPPPSSSFPKNATIIFDYRDLPPDPEELAAIQAMKELRRRTSLKTRRRIHQSPAPAEPAKTVGELPLSQGLQPAPQGRSLPEIEDSLRQRSRDRLYPGSLNAPGEPQRTPGAQPGNTNALKYGFREFCAPEEPEPDPGSGDREGYSSNLSRKRGAQPGNTNALKYGFYSRRLPTRELDGLEDTAATSLKDEIDVMRVFSRKVAELGADVDDLDEATSLLRVLSLATSSINRLVRTHTRIPDPDLDPALLLRTALLELEEEWPELKAFGDKYRNKPRNETPPITGD